MSKFIGQVREVFNYHVFMTGSTETSSLPVAALLPLIVFPFCFIAFPLKIID